MLKTVKQLCWGCRVVDPTHSDPLIVRLNGRTRRWRLGNNYPGSSCSVTGHWGVVIAIFRIDMSHVRQLSCSAAAVMPDALCTISTTSQIILDPVRLIRLQRHYRRLWEHTKMFNEHQRQTAKREFIRTLQWRHALRSLNEKFTTSRSIENEAISSEKPNRRATHHTSARLWHMQRQTIHRLQRSIK